MTSEFKLGDHVWHRHRGDTGTVARIDYHRRTAGTNAVYTVQWDDGKREAAVHPDMLSASNHHYAT